MMERESWMAEGAEFPGRPGQRHQSRQVQGLVWSYRKWGRAGEMTVLPKRGLWKGLQLALYVTRVQPAATSERANPDGVPVPGTPKES